MNTTPAKSASVQLAARTLAAPAAMTRANASRRLRSAAAAPANSIKFSAKGRRDSDGEDVADSRRAAIADGGDWTALCIC
jgi:hypothetical protein